MCVCGGGGTLKILSSGRYSMSQIVQTEVKQIGVYTIFHLVALLHCKTVLLLVQ